MGFDYLYEFVYGFDEFGSRFRTILMILWCVHVVVVWLPVLGCNGGGWWYCVAVVVVSDAGLL